jgi:hypothetical protein
LIATPLVGAFAGAVFGVASLAMLGLLVDGPGGFPYVWDAFVFAGVAGCALGVIAFSVVSWGMLRHVPLGRVIAETGAGTLIGAVASSLASGLNPLGGLVGALLGFCIGAVQLRFREPPANALLR